MERKQLFSELKLQHYISFDLETTGLNHDQNRITEIGMVEVENGEIVREMNWLVNPGVPIPHNIEKLTGITNEMVKGKPRFNEIADEILMHIENVPLVGQNVIFDVNFLEAAFRRKNKDFRGWQPRYKEYHYITNIYYDTAYLGRLLFPFFDRFNLKSLAENLGYEPDVSHRATDDARTTALVFNQIIEKLGLLKMSELEDLNKLFSKNRSPLKNLFQDLYKLKTLEPDSWENDDWGQLTIEHANVVGRIPDMRSVTPDEDSYTTPIDKEKISNIFRENGLISQKLEQFESRDEQIRMVEKVVEAFNFGQILTIEAGTGTGKSLAYLVPAIHWVTHNRDRGARIIISTNTKTLQEQLFFKDLPFLKAALGMDFSAVLLKGKSNYLCLDRYENVMASPEQRMAEHDKVQAGLLTHWKNVTQTGDIAGHHGFMLNRNMALWTKFIAEEKYCPGKKCRFYSDCFLWNARNNARLADIVVVNHALLMSDVAAENAILGPYDFLIIDEAHNLEKTAIDYLGAGVTYWEAKNAFEDLYTVEKNLGVVVSLQKALQAGSVKDEVKQRSIFNHVESIKTRVSKSLVESREFFTRLRNQMKVITEQNFSDTNPEARITLRLKNGDKLYTFMNEHYPAYRTHLSGILVELNDLIESFRDIDEDEVQKKDPLLQDLLAKQSRIETFRNTLDFISGVEEAEYVYWCETSPQSREYDLRLYAVPLKIDTILHDRLFSRLEAAVLTSATLTVDKKFDYFYKKLGLQLLEPDKRSQLQLDSPFNLEKQALLAVPGHFPLPSSPEYAVKLEELMNGLVREAGRGTLVLFTAYNLLKKIYYKTKEMFQADGTLVMGQAIDGSRMNLINQFREEHGSVLMGTDSFWEGVDVPGKALELLIITRLPFEVPSDPVVAARFELIEARGGNPFMEYMLPEATIKLKQGFGRLIRSKNDYGVVIITDPRLVTKSYARMIRNSLPVAVHRFEDSVTMTNFVKDWFQRIENEINEEISHE